MIRKNIEYHALFEEIIHEYLPTKEVFDSFVVVLQDLIYDHVSIQKPECLYLADTTTEISSLCSTIDSIAELKDDIREMRIKNLLYSEKHHLYINEMETRIIHSRKRLMFYIRELLKYGFFG